MAVDLSCPIILLLFLFLGYPAAWKDRASEGNLFYQQQEFYFFSINLTLQYVCCCFFVKKKKGMYGISRAKKGVLVCLRGLGPEDHVLECSHQDQQVPDEVW